jgi:hypothetical protein
MECHRSLGVVTLVALMATHRALSTPLTPTACRARDTATPQPAMPPRWEAAPAETRRRPAPARPAAQAPR